MGHPSSRGRPADAASLTFDEVVKTAKAEREWTRTSGNLGLFRSGGKEEPRPFVCLPPSSLFLFPLRHSDQNINQLPLQLENGLSSPARTRGQKTRIGPTLARIKSSFPVPLAACQLASRLCAQTAA